MLLKLAEILRSIEYDRLSELTVEKAKITLLNFIGTGLAAADSKEVLAEIAVWDEQRSAGKSVILGHAGRVSSAAAASVNAMMGQVFLLEDCQEHTLSHPGVTSIPVALAVAESREASGKRVIEAIVAGYECIGRIGGVLIVLPGFPDYGLRPASTLAPFGAAAAAARILGLDAEGIAAALSIAGNTASGVMEFVNTGTADICLQNCFAAKSAVMAAMLAERGIQAAPTILEGRFGLGRAMNRKELDWGAALVSNPGHYMIDHSFIKRYPGCGHVLATAQAASSITKQHKIKPQDIDKVTVGVSRGATEFPGVDNPGPYHGTISAMMSHQFMVSSAIVHGEVSVDTVKKYDDADVAQTARKVFVEFDAEVDAAFPKKTGAKLEILLKSGEVLRDFQEDLKPMEPSEVIERFEKVARQYFSDERVAEILDKVMRLEELGSVSGLMGLLEA